MRKFLIIITIIILSLAWTAYAGEKQAEPASGDKLIEPLQPLKPFIGKTWRGAFLNSPQGQPMEDVSRWERALNGTAVRIIHSLNQGQYGGETLILWDAGKKSLVFFYFTTGGFYTQGTISFEGGKFISSEQVIGNPDGITEVKAVGEMLPDGRMRSSSQYLKKGEWVEGHIIVYKEDPTARVIFR